MIQKDIEMNEELKDRIKQLENDLKGTCRLVLDVVDFHLHRSTIQWSKYCS